MTPFLQFYWQTDMVDYLYMNVLWGIDVLFVVVVVVVVVVVAKTAVLVVVAVCCCGCLCAG